MQRAHLITALSLVLTTLVGALSGGHFAFDTAFEVARWPTLLACALVAILTLRSDEPTHRRTILACVLVAFTIQSSVGGSRALRHAEPAPTASRDTPVRVMTANLMCLLRHPYNTLAALQSTEADVLVFQEVTQPWVDLLEDTFAETHPHTQIWPHPGPNGFAVFSRWPLDPQKLLYAGYDRPHSQLTTVHTPDGPVLLANVHLKSPSYALRYERHRLYRALEESTAMRGKQWRDLQAHLKPHTGPTIVLGDFNTTDYEPLYRQISRHFVDTAREAAVWPSATWPVGRDPLPFPMARIDYIFTSTDFALQSVFALPQGGSDHRGLTAVLH